MQRAKKALKKESLLTVSYEDFLVESLKDPKEAEEYLNAALEDEDHRVFLLALRDIADAHGIGNLASAAELNRENIYRMLSGQGNPRLSSVVALLRALGLRLSTKAEGVSAYKERDEESIEVAPSVAPATRPKYIGNLHLAYSAPKPQPAEMYNEEAA